MECFYLPAYPNKITASDIQKGYLRVTVSLKPIFPNDNSPLTITINGSDRQVKFTHRGSRSHLIGIGHAAMVELKIEPGSKLKITRRAANHYLIENADFLFSKEQTDRITYEDLKQLRVRYWEALKKHPFPPPPSDGKTAAMIHYFKRKVNGLAEAIGPYIGLSVFEAANRIASDLVIINGLIQLIQSDREPVNSILTVRLGNRHIPGKGDFTINGKEGEAFNVAASFYKSKMRSTINKWKAPLSIVYILVNAEVFDEIKGDENDHRIIKVKDWADEY